MIEMKSERVVPDRVNIDIDGLRQEIEEIYADNPLWSELSLSRKMRRLIEERLADIKKERAEAKKPQ